MRLNNKSIFIGIICLVGFSIAGVGCDHSQIKENAFSITSSTPIPTNTQNHPGHTPTRSQTSLPATPRTPHQTNTPTPFTTPLSIPIGPDDYPAGINPLNGLPVKYPENLLLPPALVSVSNAPVSTRPQAGLSFSPFVYELFIGEGATRFLAVFYGDYPEDTYNKDAYVKPIRSGRLPYESLRLLYSGFLVFAGASTRVQPGLSEYISVSNEDSANINGARIDVSEIKRIAQLKQGHLGQPHLSGLKFDSQPPSDGKKGNSLWVAFHYNAQVFWRYDQPSGAYLRYQNDGEGTPLRPFSDHLTNEILSFENVIVLFARYHRYDDLFFNIDLMYVKRNPALLFRDGNMYEIYWTSRNETYEMQTGKIRPIRYVNYDFSRVPLKPGQTWVEIVQLYSPYYETIASEDYRQLATKTEPGSGHWAVRHILTDFEPTPTGSGIIGE